jgi:hypothetical protein
MDSLNNRSLDTRSMPALWRGFVASPLWPATVFAALLIAWASAISAMSPG